MTSDTTDAQPDRGQRPIGSPDGFGWYGILTETPAGLLCAECGWEGTHLGLHAYKAHGLPAVRYKRLHGLRLSQGLIVAEVKHRMSQIRTENPNPYLAAARDPAAATAARLAQGSPISPAGDAARTANLDRTREQRRRGLVIDCAECGVAFCPSLLPPGAASAAGPAPADITAASRRRPTKPPRPTRPRLLDSTRRPAPDDHLPRVGMAATPHRR